MYDGKGFFTSRGAQYAKNVLQALLSAHCKRYKIEGKLEALYPPEVFDKKIAEQFEVTPPLNRSHALY